MDSDLEKGSAAAPPRGLSFQNGNWYLMAKTGSLARQRWAGMLAQLKVSPSQYGVLMALGEAGPLGQQHLAELVGVDPRNAVPIIDALAAQGLVHREVDPVDRRRRVLDLTAKGRGVVADLASVGAAPFGAAALPSPYLATLVAEQSYLRVSGIASAGT